MTTPPRPPHSDPAVDEPLAVAAEGAAKLLDISRSQFFKLHSCGKVPMPVQMGMRAPRWIVSELKAWLAAGSPDRRTWERIRNNR